MLDLLDQLKGCLREQKQAVLATIVHKEGSTYRGVGAKSLFFLDGQFTSVLSGGCVEHDMAEHAEKVLATGRPTIVKYDLRTDDDAPWGLGVGCNGSLDILLQPLDPVRNPEEAEKIYEVLRKKLDYSIPFTVLTILSSSIPSLEGEMFVWEEERSRVQDIFGEFCRSIQAEIQLLHSADSMGGQGWGNRIIKGCFQSSANGPAQVDLLIELYQPIPRLVIFGAGPDAIPVVKVSKLINWHVTVVDHRPSYANRRIFPEADHVELVSPGAYPDQLSLHEGTYAVIMSHHFEQDAVYLEYLVDKPVAYIGVLGPGERTERLLNRLRSKGITPSSSMLDRLHSPVGLDIGADSAEEIALSIVSEVVSKYHHREGHSQKVNLVI